MQRSLYCKDCSSQVCNFFGVQDSRFWILLLESKTRPWIQEVFPRILNLESRKVCNFLAFKIQDSGFYFLNPSAD